jgi:NAD(P)-dependent dehydrogenase (short-subunit alcohol dehydrogenase family)
MTSVQGKVVFITGGARGIGAEVARPLRNKGAKLVLTDLDKAELAALATELGEDRVLTVVADVRDLAAMQTAAGQAVERFGGIDVVVASKAGNEHFVHVLRLELGHLGVSVGSAHVLYRHRPGPRHQSANPPPN